MNLLSAKMFIATTIALAVLSGCSKTSAPHTSDNPTQATAKETATERLIASQIVNYSPPAIDMLLTETAVHTATAASTMTYRKTSEARHFPLQDISQLNENYAPNESNGIKQVSAEPLSTFSIDVDTGSYANVRKLINMGVNPVYDAVREEAFINYFDYDYSVPQNTKQPFSVTTEIAAAPWNSERKLLKIALKGYEIPASARKPSHLVFLVDTSGSMRSQDKLPLLKSSLIMLTKNLQETDMISLVTYAGTAKVILEPTKGKEQNKIINAINQLVVGGNTNGQSGIQLAYQQAQAGFIKGGVNRILLATDGDFNVGISSVSALKELVAKERDNGISLTTLGFGRGNYNDEMMEQLANIGNGNHAYIDSLRESRKVFHNQVSGTLQTIASDVKIQVEFNPNVVNEYRLIGYQNRLLNNADFNNDKVDAGEIGAGHTVTAFYELTLIGQQGQIDDLRYGTKTTTSTAVIEDEVAQVKLRYKLPDESNSKLIKTIINTADIQPQFDKASSDFQFASAVAAFAQKLKALPYMDSMSYQAIVDIARNNRGEDQYNYRGEFITLVETAESL